MAKTKPSSTKPAPGQKGPAAKKAGKGVGSATASAVRQKAERRRAK